MSGPALIYDPRFHTFESWASLMVELYSAQNLEIPTHGTTWQGWAVGIKSIDVFANEAIPDPYIFDDWMEWAQMTVNAVNPRV
jgi:hypothetical protein